MFDFSVIETHPNPQRFREKFLTLDGEWDFSFDKDNIGLKESWQKKETLNAKINVPFVYQSKLSGIESNEFCEVIWYKKKFQVPSEFDGKQIILNFGAVDYECDVFVNGIHITHHLGGYTSFECDITRALVENQNDITVRVNDRTYARETIRGKQLWEDGEFGCWYKRYSGIWQSVWLEAVDEKRIGNFIIKTDVDTNSINLKMNLLGLNEKSISIVKAEVMVNNTTVANVEFRLFGNYLNESISVGYSGSPFRRSEWWSPEHPTLYQLKLTLVVEDAIKDEIQTYFGIRKLEAYNGKVLLNNFPFYHRSVLNQGYYPEGYITPENDERIISDIRLIKSLGFNAMRIHQKIESSKFLYFCDRLGIAVWEEIPSMYEYRELSAHDIVNQVTDIVTRDINHPSITAYVMFNESWGVQQIRFDESQQRLANACYYLVKSMDNTRFVISNDGWQQTETDLVTIHDYSAYGDELTARYGKTPYEIGENPVAGQRRQAFAIGYAYKGQPVMLTEYGGISYSNDEGWGYNEKVKTPEEFLKRFDSLTTAIKKVPYMCGYCYTQFVDVENEQNGIMTINREPKVSVEEIRKILLK